MTHWLVALAMTLTLGLLASCGDSDGSPDPAPDTASAAPADTGATGAQKAFGEACTTADDCKEGVCHEFGQGGSLCTIACVAKTECPDGSEGQKCNSKGVCKP